MPTLDDVLPPELRAIRRQRRAVTRFGWIMYAAGVVTGFGIGMVIF